MAGPALYLPGPGPWLRPPSSGSAVAVVEADLGSLSASCISSATLALSAPTYITGTGTYKHAVNALGPGLNWTLDGTTGATDQSGNARNGTGAGGITIGGFSGSPITGETTSTDFDGSNDLVSSTYAAFVNGTTRTFTGWANRDNTSAYHSILGDTGPGSGAWLALGNGTQDVIWSADGFSTNVTWFAEWPGNGVWVHYALVFDESANSATLYINGSPVATTPTQTYSTAYAVNGGFQAGALAAAVLPFDGKQAHVAVYERALTATEIDTLYDSGLHPPIVASGVSSATLVVNVPRIVPLDPASGISSATATVTAATKITLVSASAVSSATLALSASTRVILDPANAVASATLAVTAATKVALNSASAVASPTLALTAATTVTLGPSSAVCSATLTLFTPKIVSLDPANAVSSATLVLTAPTFLTLTASGISSGTLTVTVATRVALNPSSAVASATLALTAQTYVTLGPASGVSSATLALTAPARVILASASAVATTTLSLTAPTTVVLGPASALSSATVSLTAQTYITLAPANAVSSATLSVFAPGGGIVPLNAANAVSSATLTLTAVPRLSLSASGISSATLALTAPTRVVLQASSAVASASAVVYIPSFVAEIPLAPANALAAAALVLRAPTAVPLQSVFAVASALLSLSAQTYVVLTAASAQSSATLFVFIPEDRWNADDELRWDDDGTVTRWPDTDEDRMLATVGDRWDSDNEGRW